MPSPMQHQRWWPPSLGWPVLTHAPSPDSFGQIWVVVVDHPIYFSWVSALLEMPSKSA